jgi:ubiquinone biosynthesis protein UbiJ
MFPDLPGLLAPPVLERLTLVINHVLGSEAVATERLRPHAGRAMVFHMENWPALLPPAPPLAWRITPAGLLEWCGLEPPADAALQMHLDASNPALLVARALVGDRPTVRIDGDAELAAEVGWLLQNLRWDVAADLERLFGRAVAQQVHQLGRTLAGALRSALRAVEPIVERFGPGSRRGR